MAQSGTRKSNLHTVKVTVTDVDEPGTITTSTGRPQQGTTVTATLTDPDDVTQGSTTWTWEHSQGRNTWTVITGATNSSYTPVAADTGRYLRVSAAYTDGHGAGKTVAKALPNVVTGHLLTSLTATTTGQHRQPGTQPLPRL